MSVGGEGDGDGDAALREYLLQLHGPLMHGQALWSALGFRSSEAFGKALRRQTVPVQTFEIPGRRGRFAKTLDVAAWLQTLGGPACLPGTTLITGAPAATAGPPNNSSSSAVAVKPRKASP